MPNLNQNLVDVEFIAQQINWFIGLSFEQEIEHLRKNPKDAFCVLPHHDRGEITIGREAFKRFWSIANRFLESNPAKKARIHFDEFVSALRSEFSSRFLKEGRPLDESNVDRMISVAYKRVARNFEELQHFIPVNLFMTNSIPEFNIGPVAFVHETEFFSRHQLELDAQRASIAKQNQAHVAELIEAGYPASSMGTEQDAIALGNLLVDSLINTFREHKWFAIVTVPACDALVSYDKALFLTKGALNVLKLLLGGEYTDRLRTAEDLGHRSKGGKLSRRKNGELEISISLTPQDNVVGDRWLEMLTTTHSDWFKMASELLRTCSDLDAAPPLCVRFVDALAWYGDAIAEHSNAAKIVKFVSAIERLVCTGKEHDANDKVLPLSDIVIPRAGMFYSRAFGVNLSEAQTQVANIYDCRSRIVHGSISPFDESLRSDAARTQDATRMILLVALGFFTSLGINDRNLKEKELRHRYRQLVSEVPDEPTPVIPAPAS